MKQNLRDALLKKCLERYQAMYEDGMQLSPPDRCGTPPERMVIALGTLRENDYNAMYPLAQKETAFRYSSDGLQEADIETQPDFTENKAYYREAYAELSCQDNGTAFVMIQFGKRFARCYRYQIHADHDLIQLTDEELLWVS